MCQRIRKYQIWNDKIYQPNKEILHKQLTHLDWEKITQKFANIESLLVFTYHDTEVPMIKGHFNVNVNVFHMVKQQENSHTSSNFWKSPKNTTNSLAMYYNGSISRLELWLLHQVYQCDQGMGQVRPLLVLRPTVQLEVVHLPHLSIYRTIFPA